MATIKVQRKCAICKKEHDITMAERDYGSFYGVLLSDIVFCEECRKRLLCLLYPGIRELEDGEAQMLG